MIAKRTLTKTKCVENLMFEKIRVHATEDRTNPLHFCLANVIRNEKKVSETSSTLSSRQTWTMNFCPSNIDIFCRLGFDSPSLCEQRTVGSR